MSCKAIFQLETIKYDFVCKFRRTRAAFHYLGGEDSKYFVMHIVMHVMRLSRKADNDAEKAACRSQLQPLNRLRSTGRFFCIVIRFFDSVFDVFVLSCMAAMMSCATAHHCCGFRPCHVQRAIQKRIRRFEQLEGSGMFPRQG